MNAFRGYTELFKGLKDFRDNPAHTALLVTCMRADDVEAKDELILSTLKFIANRAAAHCRRRGACQDLDDLIQEGVEWVSTGIHLYDPAKSASLESFIRSRLKFVFIDYWYKSKAINQTSYCRHVERLIRRAREELNAALGRDPIVEELASHMEMEECRVREFLTHSRITLVGVPENEDGQTIASIIDLASAEKTPFELAELSELRDLAVKCLGTKDAELLLAYIERGSAYFRELYFQWNREGITAVASRKYKERLVKKLRACLKNVSKLSARGGNHESKGTPDRRVTQRVFKG